MALKQHEEQLMNTNPDWIRNKYYNNSIDVLLEKYPEGAPAKIVASSLGMKLGEYMEFEARLLNKIKKYFN